MPLLIDAGRKPERQGRTVLGSVQCLIEAKRIRYKVYREHSL